MPLRVAPLLALALAAPAGAQERRDTLRADSAVTLPPIGVRAAPVPMATIGGASGLRARLDSLALPAVPTVERVLRSLPFLHVRTNTRGEAEISVRGSDSRQVAVLVDGVPLTLAWDARADVSVIPATAPVEIEFVRGVSSMLHGPNVLGGVVELGVGQSFLQPRSPTADVAAELDHLGGYGVKSTVTLPVTTGGGALLVRAGASHRDTPGVPRARGVAEPVPPDGDLRLNTDAASVDGFLALRYSGYDGAWVAFSGSAFRAERGIAAELGVDDGARFWRYPHVSRTLAVLSAGTGDRATPLGRGDIEASLGVDLGRTEIDAYTDRSYTTPEGFEDGRDRTLTARVLGDHTLGTRGELRAAFTVSEIRHDESLPAGDARYRQRLWSVGTETAWRLVERRGAVDWLRFSVGGAWDVGQTPESGGRPPLDTRTALGLRAGASMSLSHGSTLLHAAVSRRARFPALRELYSGALNRFAPNPDLQPEKLLAIEGGVTARLGNSEIQAVGFRHQMSDAVVRLLLPDGRFMRVNRNRLRSLGLELLLSTALWRFTLTGDLTAQTVDLTDTDAGVTNRPENLPELFGGIEALVALPHEFRLAARARYEGNQFCISPGTGLDSELEAGATLAAELGRTWSLRPGGGWFGRLETRAAVDNVNDVALFEQCGLPQPGRVFRVQVRVF
ncbi:MAG TPA: TonB-dependent receptor [Gemmatimonadales bacterium]|nr:TonB-dependent receptor [Gemmatimonadales bacterium]